MHPYRLRKELPALAADFGYASARIPDAAEVPGGRDLTQAHEAKKAERLRPRVDRSTVPHMAKDSAGAEAMARSLSVEMRKIDSFLEGATPSLRGFALAVHSGKTRGVRLEDLKALHQTLARERHLGTSQKVRYILGQLDPAELRNAAARGAAGEKPVGFGLFNSALKDCVASVRFNDQAPASAEDWMAVVNALSLNARRGEFARRLDPLMRHGFASAAPDAAWDFAEWLEARLADLEFVVEFLPRFRGMVDALALLFPYDFDHAAVAERLELGEALRAIDGNLPSDFKEPSAIPAIERLLPEDPALQKLPLFADLKRIRDYIGSSGIEAPSFVAMRNQITPELDRLAAVKTRLAAADGDLKALAEVGAPRWAAALRASPETAVEAIPADWPRAWAWAIMTGTVDRIVYLGNGNEHRQNRNDILVRRQRAFTRLIRLRTLLGLNLRMTPDTQVALTTFTQAVARIGRGTGQSAGRFRRAAQEAAQEASIAAPVWIMPEYRIAEQLPPKLEDFDLVILDEASQSDVTAVAALARGKQLLIVGDEQQVSPANVGTKNAVVDALRTTHLAEIPGAALIDAQASIFEIAHRMHPTSHVSLREHFRCAPPIIAFSSQFYDGGLIPLRVPTASERFDPPLVDVHVRNATRAGKLNRAEADWIVGEIARIVSDPRHDDRSIGVISLIGNSQADLIQKLLIEDERIGTDRMRKHRLIVGDARTMQGQERSVMFLTMVATPDSVLSQTGRADLQRMNVAMSRARDRLYFVHSTSLDELQPGDIKAKALKHLRDPMPDGNRIVDGDVFSLCQSGFERDVLKRLLDAGYRAIPQVKAGGYAIDIVAEGASDARLAIELDGDRFHGPEDWDRDMARQSQLERAGWVFWRVFGSQWYSDPDRWWGELTRSLADLRIEPIGTAAIDGRFTEFVEVDAFERDPGKKKSSEKQMTPRSATLPRSPTAPIARN
ncbi:MAG: hypothetical protein JWL93_2431 [Hyphomicrobiales bacterium]|nr:hypothetical protein [Hyphomicrobiales bacterium]